jgi:hypothetical protein
LTSSATAIRLSKYDSPQVTTTIDGQSSKKQSEVMFADLAREAKAAILERTDP